MRCNLLSQQVHYVEKEEQKMRCSKNAIICKQVFYYLKMMKRMLNIKAAR